MTIIAKGKHCNVICAECYNGKEPAAEFLTKLRKTDNKVLLKIMARFQRLADYGKSYYNDQQFKHITGQIWELKVGQYRFPCFWYEGNWVVTHGFQKKQNKWPPGELKRTKRITDEFLASQ